MSTSSHSFQPAATTQAPPFLWLNPLRPTTFRVVVGLGLGLISLLLINLLTPAALSATAYVLSAIIAVASYLLAEVLMVALVAIGPFVGFVYGVYAYFTH